MLVTSVKKNWAGITGCSQASVRTGSLSAYTVFWKLPYFSSCCF